MEEKHKCEMLNVPDCKVRHILLGGMWLFAAITIASIFALPILENAIHPIFAKFIVSAIIFMASIVFAMVIDREIVVASRLHRLENLDRSESVAQT